MGRGWGGNREGMGREWGGNGEGMGREWEGNREGVLMIEKGRSLSGAIELLLR